MAKIIKEIIMLLLVCLVALLLLAVVFYEFIPTRKNVSEVSSYKDTAKISELLSDDIDKNVILTYEEGEYEVTSSDLKNYEVAEKYVPGKANPFAPPESTTKVKGSADSNKSSDTGKGSNTDKTKKDSNSSEYIKDKGTK